MPANDAERVNRYSSDDGMLRPRVWLLFVSDLLVILMASIAGLLVLMRGFDPLSADVLVAVAVAAGALISLVVLKFGKPVAATHVTVAVVFASLWVLNLATISRADTNTSPAYLIAALMLPAFLLGVWWTLFYGLLSVVVIALVARLLFVYGILPSSLAIGFATDFILSFVFTAVYVSAIATIYEKAVLHIKDLLARQREVTVELARLNDEIRQSEAQKRQFYRDTISSVTDGKLLITDGEELQDYRTEADFEAAIDTFVDTSAVRQPLAEYLYRKGLPRDDLFLTGVGEAMTNAVKHAGGGFVFAGCSEYRAWAGVADRGPGITTIHLPRAMLRRGYSSTVSMGMGYSIMLEASDCVMLKTGPDGTTVVLLKHIGAVEPAITLDNLPDTWDTV